jgi:hypothetical protein
VAIGPWAQITFNGFYIAGTKKGLTNGYQSRSLVRRATFLLDVCVKSIATMEQREFCFLGFPVPLMNGNAPAILAWLFMMPKLRSLPPLLAQADLRTVKPPPYERNEDYHNKRADPFYGSSEFRQWRATVVARAGNRCEAIDAYGHRCIKATPRYRMFADHIIEINDGGSQFDLANGQCLCFSHHEIKTIAAKKHRLQTIQNPKAQS